MVTTMRNIIYDTVYGGICSLVVLIVGLVLPRRWFNPDNKLFAERKWENGGRIYNRLHISKWKSKLPDMSKYIKSMIAKRLYGKETTDDIRKLIAETCVAEAAHLVLMAMSLGMIAIWQDIGGVICCFCYAIGNLPYIIIQRYNRPRLVRMMTWLESRA